MIAIAIATFAGTLAAIVLFEWWRASKRRQRRQQQGKQP